MYLSSEGYSVGVCGLVVLQYELLVYADRQLGTRYKVDACVGRGLEWNGDVVNLLAYVGGKAFGDVVDVAEHLVSGMCLGLVPEAESENDVAREESCC